MTKHGFGEIAKKKKDINSEPQWTGNCGVL